MALSFGCCGSGVGLSVHGDLSATPACAERAGWSDPSAAGRKDGAGWIVSHAWLASSTSSEPQEGSAVTIGDMGAAASQIDGRLVSTPVRRSEPFVPAVVWL